MKKLLVSISLLLSALYTQADVSLPEFFSNGMVLQQQTEVPLWGFASKDEHITVTDTWSGITVSTIADQAGKWKVMLQTPSFGGPYSLIIKGNNTVNINDILIGEVWLASGQSNMEMPMEGWLPECPVMNGPQDIASSLNNNVRVFMVQRAVSFTPLADVTGSWKSASPQNTPKFGATCYYFAKKLNAELGIPVGIINSSWGGTPDESWISADFLKDVPEYAQTLKNIKASEGMVDNTDKWVKSKPAVSKLNKTWAEIDLNDSEIAQLNFNDADWPSMQLPCNWESTQVRTFDGVVWFRKEIEITPQMAGKNLVIALGAIDDMDRTYFNGKLIGEYMQDGFYLTQRVYSVQAADVKAGKSVIAVRVTDTQGGGGLNGKPETMKYYTQGDEKNAIGLNNGWKYMPVAEYVGGNFYKYDYKTGEFFKKPIMPAELGCNTATTLYNAMIAPLAGYKIAGAIWYQGETNVGRGEEYSRTFPKLILNWRNDWKQGSFPFYYVQIAPWNYGGTSSVEVREAQRLTLSVENTAMAVTMDIGNNQNIHPANKTDVGNRLALLALKNVYEKNVQCSGPIYQSQKIEGNKIILSFANAEGLNVEGGVLQNFEIADKSGKFVKAEAVIVDDKVSVSAAGVKKPVAVRYLWSDTVNVPVMKNSAGLPASSFQTTRCWK